MAVRPSCLGSSISLVSWTITGRAIHTQLAKLCWANPVLKPISFHPFHFLPQSLPQLSETNNNKATYRRLTCVRERHDKGFSVSACDSLLSNVVGGSRWQAAPLCIRINKDSTLASLDAWQNLTYCCLLVSGYYKPCAGFCCSQHSVAFIWDSRFHHLATASKNVLCTLSDLIGWSLEDPIL